MSDILSNSNQFQQIKTKTWLLLTIRIKRLLRLHELNAALVSVSSCESDQSFPSVLCQEVITQ